MMLFFCGTAVLQNLKNMLIKQLVRFAFLKATGGLDSECVELQTVSIDLKEVNKIFD